VSRIAVFGTDNRQTLSTQRAPSTDKIGTLAVKGSNICSAFCVSPDTIATASHCLFGTAQSQAPTLTDLVFKIGEGPAASTSPLAGKSAAAIKRNIRAGTVSLRITPPIDAANDWAVARLAQPVCRSGGLPLSPLTREEVLEKSEAGAVYQIAMHRDFTPATLALGGPCGMAESFPLAGPDTIAHDFANAPSILMHNCDTGAGSSGSPLLIDGMHGPEVVGINVGTYVLSRTSPSSSTGGGTGKSEPIANTAIATARFREVVEAFTFATSSLPAAARSRRSMKPPRAPPGTP
jgi:protease YdgD